MRPKSQSSKPKFQTIFKFKASNNSCLDFMILNFGFIWDLEFGI